MDLSSVMPTGESSTLSVRQRHVKNRHSPEEWEQQKELIERLYLDEDKTVEETMRYLKDEEGFIVGERKFKMQLKEWGFDKNIRSSVMQLMLAKATKRKFEEDKDTKFRYKGRDILPERFSHYAKRSHVKNGKSASPSACELLAPSCNLMKLTRQSATPSFVSYCTMSTNLSSLSNALRRVASMNGSTASIASTVSAFRHGSLALRRSLSNLSGRTFSAFKRRNSHHSDRCSMSLADLDDFSFSFPSYEEMEFFGERGELGGREANAMSEKVIHGCRSCQIQVANTVREPFNKLRSHCINFDSERAWEAAEELSRTILPLCRSCRVISYKYILSVLFGVALDHYWGERYHESIYIHEKILQTCMEENLYDCSYVMFNCIHELVHIYAYQGLLHEVEQKLLHTGTEKEGAERLTWFCNRLLLAQIFTHQQRPQDALREYGSLSTACIEYYGLHSAFMHRIVISCAEACNELHDYRTSTDLYRRLLAEENPTDYVWQGRTFAALLGLSDTYRSAGSFQNCKKYAYQATEILQFRGSAPAYQLSRWRLADLVRCHFNLAVSFDNEGNSAEAESYFSRVIVGCENLNEQNVTAAAVSITLALQHHYYDRPRRIDALDPRIDGNHLAHLAEAVSGRPEALQRLLVTIIWQAETLSRSHQSQRAEYLFNQAKGLLDPSNLRLQCFFAIQIARHHRRKGEWKYVLRYLEKAVILSEQMYGPNHACTVSFKERLAASGEEMEKRGLSTNAMAQSLSLLTFSSLSTGNTGSNEPDELDFLEDGMFWDQPPASLLEFA
jgi:tetratricopeptide (TPR) repeat protein